MKARDARLPRRSFLTTASAGAAAAGAALTTGSVVFAQSPPAAGAFQPARHAQDDWLEQLPGKHRFFMDTMSATGFGHAVFFANNFYTGNKNGYGLEGADLAVVICARHQSTPFAYNDAMWAKYGKSLSARANFTDPKSKEPATVNVFRASGYGAALTNNGVTLDSIIKNGAHFAVCQMATRAYSGFIAREMGGKAEEIYQELVSNLIPNAHMVPAGIVALARAQERGYSFTNAG